MSRVDNVINAKDKIMYYTVVKKSDIKASNTKCMAFEMYLEGLGFRAIG